MANKYDTCQIYVAIERLSQAFNDRVTDSSIGSSYDRYFN